MGIQAFSTGVQALVAPRHGGLLTRKLGPLCPCIGKSILNPLTHQRSPLYYYCLFIVSCTTCTDLVPPLINLCPLHGSRLNHWPSRAVPGLLLLLSQGLCGGVAFCNVLEAQDARIWLQEDTHPEKSLAVTSWPCSSMEMQSLRSLLQEV